MRNAARPTAVSDVHTPRVIELLEDMMRRAKAGRIRSLIFIAEEIGREHPHYGIVGRLRADPMRAIGHLAVMQEKTTQWAAEQVPDLD